MRVDKSTPTKLSSPLLELSDDRLQVAHPFIQLIDLLDILVDLGICINSCLSGCTARMDRYSK
jgi:hypothetical protein